MRYPAAPLTLLFAAVTLTAQSKLPSAYTALEAHRSLFAQGCPVNFSAQRQSPTEIIRVDKTSDARKAASGQGLRLTFDHQQISKIAEANITVHAFSLKPRLLPVDTDAAPQADIAQDFHLTLRAQDAKLLEAHIWMNNVGSIGWVELNNIVHANGTTWHNTNLSQCHATPSGVMLVAATASASR